MSTIGDISSKIVHVIVKESHCIKGLCKKNNKSLSSVRFLRNDSEAFREYHFLLSLFASATNVIEWAYWEEESFEIECSLS